MNQDVQIVKAIAEHLGLAPEDLDRHALLREELNLGPIELDELLSDLARKFNVSFDPEDVDNLKKVDDLIIFIEDNSID